MTKRRPRKARRGFALVITVILLALLMLALVSTATLTHIEASIGYNSRRDSQAKQNALFALNRALGELQRQVGPDQKSTAQANIASSSLQSPNWTGVWNSSGGSEQTWLISGNEDEASGTFSFDPSGEVTGLASGMSATAAVTIAQTSGEVGPAALLVGPKAAGTDWTKYVAAPLMDLKGDAPGGNPADTSDDVAIGRYAWWVGDEGVKARVNLRDPRLESGDAYFTNDGTGGLAADSAGGTIASSGAAAHRDGTHFESRPDAPGIRRHCTQ